MLRLSIPKAKPAEPWTIQVQVQDELPAPEAASAEPEAAAQPASAQMEAAPAPEAQQP
jgi:hypothetical protein